MMPCDDDWWHFGGMRGDGMTWKHATTPQTTRVSKRRSPAGWMLITVVARSWDPKQFDEIENPSMLEMSHAQWLYWLKIHSFETRWFRKRNRLFLRRDKKITKFDWKQFYFRQRGSISIRRDLHKNSHTWMKSLELFNVCVFLVVCRYILMWINIPMTEWEIFQVT